MQECPGNVIEDKHKPLRMFSCVFESICLVLRACVFVLRVCGNSTPSRVMSLYVAASPPKECMHGVCVLFCCRWFCVEHNYRTSNIYQVCNSTFSKRQPFLASCNKQASDHICLCKVLSNTTYECQPLNVSLFEQTLATQHHLWMSSVASNSCL